jgi:transposase-like protein
MRDFRGPQGREESLMKRPTNRKRHRPEEVVAKLRQADEALAKGVAIAEVVRSLGVSAVTLHRWRTECGAADRDPVRRLKELDIQILKEVAKWEL